MKKTNSAIVDIFMGDCGKGKIANDFSPQYDWVIRTSGANNCGHTIYRDNKKYVHNIVPSFDWRNKNVKAFIGSGTVIDLDHLLKEVSQLYSDCPDAVERLYLDPDAFTILPEHIEEDKAKNSHIGSTNRGVGPAYKEKTNRSGKKILSFIKENDNRISKLKEMGMKFKHVLELEENFSNSALLFESAQGIMIDIDHGTYPYVSCGSAGLAGIHASGFSFVKIDHVYGISKAYSTRVGNGPFPTESNDDITAHIAKVGMEIGATTKRARRCGYLDFPCMKYATSKSGATDLIITKLDILNSITQIPVCNSYKGIDKVVSPSQLVEAEPVYSHMKGWSSCASDANYEDAMALHDFISAIEKASGVKCSHISTGVSANDLRKWR